MSSPQAMLDLLRARVVGRFPAIQEAKTSDIDQDRAFKRLYERCRPYTMTTVSRMYALYQATRYVVLNRIPGDLVECGVWQGGSSMLMALTLLELGESHRALYLYDTFEGMTPPTEHDVS